jgi:hypothetical protein
MCQLFYYIFQIVMFLLAALICSLQIMVLANCKSLKADHVSKYPGGRGINQVG